MVKFKIIDLDKIDDPGNEISIGTQYQYHPYKWTESFTKPKVLNWKLRKNKSK